MTADQSHIAVCICTYKRPDCLKRLLDGLRNQQTDGLFTYSIVVIDNDRSRSAESVVNEFTATSTVPVHYDVEPQQNIALARNRAIGAAEGDYVAFFDDDQFPTAHWLLTLYTNLHKYKVDGVLGPVKPFFDVEPPRWVVKGGFYDRPSYPTGMVIDGKKGRTGNTLLKRELFAGLDEPFRPQFRTGEDQDFFRRMIEAGHVFIWCHEAIGYEVVPPGRWKRGFMLRRALLRGATAVIQPTFGTLELMKSIIAVPGYAIALPFALLVGQHRFMSLLISLFDHLGKVLALVGINPVRVQYVTE